MQFEYEFFLLPSRNKYSTVYILKNTFLKSIPLLLTVKRGIYVVTTFQALTSCVTMGKVISSLRLTCGLMSLLQKTRSIRVEGYIELRIGFYNLKLGKNKNQTQEDLAL